jgi:hypothetical protein
MLVALLAIEVVVRFRMKIVRQNVTAKTTA